MAKTRPQGGKIAAIPASKISLERRVVIAGITLSEPNLRLIERWRDVIPDGTNIPLGRQDILICSPEFWGQIRHKNPLLSPFQVIILAPPGTPPVLDCKACLRSEESIMETLAEQFGMPKPNSESETSTEDEELPLAA